MQRQSECLDNRGIISLHMKRQFPGNSLFDRLVEIVVIESNSVLLWFPATKAIKSEHSSRIFPVFSRHNREFGQRRIRT